MARKGRNISGWLVIDKPRGMTSTSVVNRVRWAFSARKAGHSGTLDPDATGVLPVALGEATKTIPYVVDALKTYRFTIRFGLATTTDDAVGEVVAVSDERPTDDGIRAALDLFVGDIMQVPPKFSAVRVAGRRAYSLAREGQDPAVKARPLRVESLLMLDRPDQDHATLEMTCGKGGYVRAVARDLGVTLKCHAHVVDLRRICAGPFDLHHGICLAEILRLAETPSLDARLRPLEEGLAGLQRLECTPEGAARLRNGAPGAVRPARLAYGTVAWAVFGQTPVAVGVYRGGELHPSRVFNV